MIAQIQLVFTAELSWHVQDSDMILSSFIMQYQNLFREKEIRVHDMFAKWFTGFQCFETFVEQTGGSNSTVHYVMHA